jgi:nitrate/nitrite transporter NarK
MLVFIFKYVWLIILVIGYIIWSFYSIKDILSNNDLDLKESTYAWLKTTVIIISIILFLIIG